LQKYRTLFAEERTSCLTLYPRGTSMS